jgi:hypothetical protein
MIIFFKFQMTLVRHVSGSVIRIQVSWSQSKMAVGSVLSGRVSMLA